MEQFYMMHLPAPSLAMSSQIQTGKSLSQIILLQIYLPIFSPNGGLTFDYSEAWNGMACCFQVTNDLIPPNSYSPYNSVVLAFQHHLQ